MKRPAVLDRIERDLGGRKARGLFRTTAAEAPDASQDLSTNSYLSLHVNDEVTGAARALCPEDRSGNLASRLVATRSGLYEELERELADWKRCEASLVFNAGYAANVGIIQALCGRDTAVFSDRLNHASIIDGIRLSGARMHRYRHRDMDDLARKLRGSTSREKLIVTDTVFSMDGDRAPLADICDLAEEQGALVMVDEAHATGVFGGTLSGLVEEENLGARVAVRVGTLSKSIAGLGGFFAGTRRLRDFLVNHARSLIYSTALPPSVLAYDLAAVRYIRSHPSLGAEVLDLAAGFRGALGELGYDTLGSTTQIVPCLAGDEASAQAMAAELSRHGIAVPPVRPPTVPAGTARLRFSIHAGVAQSTLDRVVGILDRWKRRHG
jgi:8-amino-7-oxononanoate synthase